MEDSSIEASFLSASAAEKKRRSVTHERRRRDFGLELLKKRQKVTAILGNDRFRAELEDILKTHLGGDGKPRQPRQFHDINEKQFDTTSVLKNVPRRGSLYGGAAMGNSVIPINDLRGINTSKYSIAERQVRCKLASLYRLVNWLGWTQGIYNHITVKASQEKEHFLINPFGLLYSEVTASNLVKVDLDGRIIDPGTTQLGSNLAGYMLHSAIHEGRPEIQCVIHVHTGPGVAVSTMSCGLLPISQEALTVGGVSYHDYHGIFVDEREKEEIKRNLGPVNKVMILRNHGLVALGSTIEEAFDYLYNLVLACESQVHAMSCGIANLIQVSKEISERVQEVVTQGGGGVCDKGQLWRMGELEYEAFMRMLDNLGYNTGYPYKGMEFLQPAETASKRQSLAARKAHQGEKTQLSEKTRAERVAKTSPEVKTLPHIADGKLLNTTNGVGEQELKEPFTTNDSRTLSTVIERQEPAVEVTVSPPSSAIDDTWDFLSESPQKATVETTNQKVQNTSSDGLWNFLDDDAVSPEMPARVANGSSSSSSGDSRRSSANETELSQHVTTDTERSSNVNVELTARRVANTTSEAVRALASRSEAPELSLKTATRSDTVGPQKVQAFSSSPATLPETVPLDDLAGLQKVIVTAERVASSTSGAVLKLGSSIYHQ